MRNKFLKYLYNTLEGFLCIIIIIYLEKYHIKKNNGSILNFRIEYFLYQFIFKSHYINIITLIVLDSILTQKITLTDFWNHDGNKGHGIRLILLDQIGGMPIYYRPIYGNITDVVTFCPFGIRH